VLSLIYTKNWVIKLLTIFTIVFILTNSIPTKELAKYELDNKYEKILSKASLEISNNVTILKINGSYYEMGFQHGYLLKEKVNQNYNNYSNALGNNYFDFKCI